MQHGAHVFRSASNLCAICVNSFIKRHSTALYRWWFASLNSGESRANQELLQHGFELFWNNILSKVNFIFWIQSFYPTNMDFIIRHSYFPRLHSFFSIGSNVFIPEIQSSCWGSKVITPDPRFYFRSKDPIQFNIAILKFEHVTSLKGCCSVFLNPKERIFSAPVFRITPYGRTATKSIDLISKQKKLHLQHAFLHG